MVNNLVARKELERRLEDTKRWISVMDGALSALSEPERLVLRRMYMEPGRGNLDRPLRGAGIGKIHGLSAAGRGVGAVYVGADTEFREYLVQNF